MKYLAVAIALILSSAGAFATFFSGMPPACSATPPAAATALGYTKLIYCNALNTLSVIDLNNTQNPWFLFYTTSFGFTMPADAVTSDAASISVGAANESYGGLLSTTVSANGNIIAAGGFYAEVDMKFNGSICPSGSESWPSFWLVQPEVPQIAPPFEFTELDVFEYLDGCAPATTVHDWAANGAGENCHNSNAYITYTPGNGWNTYAVRLKTSIASGTGEFDWYINNILVNTVTYSPGGKPNPAGSCASGAFSTADSQTWDFLLQGGVENPPAFRNLHIWQAP